MASESKAAVLAAMAANGAIAVSKFFAAFLTGSSALFAEAAHSVADTTNQVFLLVGLSLSDTAPDEDHPHGYGKEGFFWSFLAAIFIFVAGATFSFFEGARSLIQGESHHRSEFELIVAYAVLAVAMVFELISFGIAIRAIRANAKRKGWAFGRYLRESPDSTTRTVFWEDSAAIVGLVLAATGIALSEATGSEVWDGVASLMIGVVLTAVALMLGLQARRLLLGAAANLETRQAIEQALRSFPEVESIVRVLTMQLGQHSVLVTGDLQVSRDLDAQRIEDLINRIDARLNDSVPEVSDTFWELHRVKESKPSPN
jgi:cation diffusion facilitator family transporter